MLSYQNFAVHPWLKLTHATAITAVFRPRKVTIMHCGRPLSMTVMHYSRWLAGWQIVKENKRKAVARIEPKVFPLLKDLGDTH
jgi:hypothetical protein